MLGFHFRRSLPSFFIEARKTGPNFINQLAITTYGINNFRKCFNHKAFSLTLLNLIKSGRSRSDKHFPQDGATHIWKASIQIVIITGRLNRWLH